MKKAAGSFCRCYAAAVLLVLAPCAMANLITNGSFENTTISLAPDQICASYAGYYATCSAPGWTGNYQIGRGATRGFAGVSFNIPQPDPDGVQALIIQGLNYATQAVDFTDAGQYTLTFYAANRTAPAGNNGPQTLDVLLDGAAINGGTYVGLHGSWTLETLNFTATAGDHTISFAGLGNGGGDVTAFVDDVSLLPSSAAVPEPSSLLLISLAFVGAAGLSGRKLLGQSSSQRNSRRTCASSRQPHLPQ